MKTAVLKCGIDFFYLSLYSKSNLSPLLPADNARKTAITFFIMGSFMVLSMKTINKMHTVIFKLCPHNSPLEFVIKFTSLKKALFFLL
ncbi:hypothetical protein SAMN05443252_106333 [Bacillus sp. OV322]|nr:hypothetical protein SAMN05443252_106333 [Bacillus sp. OV322]